MLKKTKRAVAQCPNCRGVIYVDHPYTWCTHCGERLPMEIQEQLPRLDGIRDRIAAAGDSAQAADAPRRPPADAAGTSPVKGIILELRARAAGLRVAAGFMMLGIVALILAGILVFLLAGQTAQKETSPALREVSDIGETLTRLRNTLERERGAAGAGLPSGGTPLMDRDTVNATVGKIDAFQTTVRDSIRELRSEATDNRVIIPILVSSVSQRIGIIVLLIFLLQILVPTYRYNLKLAAFYSARADVLELASEMPDNRLHDLVSVLSPDSLDFGRTIKAPTDHAFEVMKEALKSGARPPK